MPAANGRPTQRELGALRSKRKRTAAASALPHQIHPVGLNPWHRWLFYGVPGTGKTRLAGSSPNALLIRPPTDQVNSLPPGSMQEWVVQDWDDLTEVLEFCRHEAAQHFEWVWLDSISLVQDQGLDHIWADTIARNPNRAKYGLDKGEYGINMQRLARWVRHLCGVPGFHVGITAHPAEVTVASDTLDPTEDSNTMVMPYIQGRNMSSKICGYMHVVGYLRKRNDKATKESYVELVTKSVSSKDHDTIYAKDQTGAVGVMRSPTIPKLMQRVSAAAAVSAGDTVTRRGRTARSSKP